MSFGRLPLGRQEVPFGLRPLFRPTLRLEVLPHASLPINGPGRHPKPDLTFVLSTIKAELDQPKGPPLALKFSKAWGDYGQDDSLPSHAIDADDNTG
jgi:hypothetical protein